MSIGILIFNLALMFFNAGMGAMNVHEYIKTKSAARLVLASLQFCCALWMLLLIHNGMSRHG